LFILKINKHTIRAAYFLKKKQQGDSKASDRRILLKFTGATPGWSSQFCSVIKSFYANVRFIEL